MFWRGARTTTTIPSWPPLPRFSLDCGSAMAPALRETFQRTIGLGRGGCQRGLVLLGGLRQQRTDAVEVQIVESLEPDTALAAVHHAQPGPVLGHQRCVPDVQRQVLFLVGEG